MADQAPFLDDAPVDPQAERHAIGAEVDPLDQEPNDAGLFGARQRHARFLAASQNPDGGFSGREGGSDGSGEHPHRALTRSKAAPCPGVSSMSTETERMFGEASSAPSAAWSRSK